MDKYYVYRPIINLIGLAEGTDKGRGYNETLAYGAYTGGPVDLVNMTLDQVDALQTKMLKHPKNKLRSSAVGRSQIVRTTMRAIRAQLPERYPGTRKFDQDCQDEMTCYLLGLRGIDKWLAGRMSEETLINNLAKEWASFPTMSGKGYYAGQQGKITVQDVKAALADVKKRHMEKQPVIEIDKPVVPESLDKEVRQKTNWLTSIFGVGGVGGLFATIINGANWQTTAVVIGSTVAVCIGVLIAGEWIVRRVRAIRKELRA